MRILAVLLLTFFSFQPIFGQQPTLKKYWVTFSDKTDTPFDLAYPEVFLSPRSLERRARQGITLDTSDLPINPFYLDSLQRLGATIHNSSKWLNGASLVITDSIAQVIDSLSFVDSVFYVGKHYAAKIQLRQLGKKRDSIPPKNLLDDWYGYAASQIKTVRGDTLHDLGFKGDSMIIAVLDGGFSNVDIMPFFDSLRAQNRLLRSHDFVDADTFAYESSSHGSQVLSVMAANYPGLMVGTAPHATYLCLKTEDTRSEYMIEECNWVAGLEYADSMGVDVVNSSLGYTTFSDKSMNHSYETLNGNTALASKAADMAFTKGMIVVNSAGNDGNNKWKYIDVPADAQNVLAVGAVDNGLSRARFSSVGPTADGRIKPDIAALGSPAIVASIYSQKVQMGSGTSFSAPVITGLVASLWQAFPEKTNAEIIEAIKLSGSQTGMPDNSIGYGIPNFAKAFQILAKPVLELDKP